MEDWTSGNVAIEVPVYIIIKRHFTPEGKQEYQEVVNEKGDWSDLVFDLWDLYQQFDPLLWSPYLRSWSGEN